MSEAINGSSPQRDAPSARFEPQGIMAHTRSGRRTTASPPFIIRYTQRHLGFLAGLVIAAVAAGVVYRFLFDPLEEREPLYYLRSCLHATGLAISGWAVLLSLAAPQSRLRGMLRRLPQTAELAIKALSRNKMAQGYDAVNAAPAKAGAHLPSAQQADRWIPAFAGKALRWRFHPGRVGRPGRWATRMSIER